MGSKKNNVVVNWGLVLECLEELGDLAYQRRVWIVGAENEVSGLEDTVAALFNDSALDCALGRSDVVFSKEVDSEIQTLREVIRTLNRECPVAEIVETEDWAHVRGHAKRLSRAIKTIRGRQSH